MNLFFVITAWSFLEALQDAPPEPRLASPLTVLSQFRNAAELFLLLFLGSGILFAANAKMPGTQDFLAALGMMLFYFYGYALKRRESFIWMAYACIFFLVRENSLQAIAFRSLEIALGVTGIRMILKGVQKRQNFSPLPKMFLGLPGFFVTAAVISLILSPFFVR